MTQGTRNGYAADWKAWVAYIGRLSKGGQEGDMFLDRVRSDADKATILALFFKERYEDGGLRARQATSISAGIRHHFLSALRSVDWFESQIVTNARAACRMSCDELREHKKEAKSKATLPVSEDMIMEARIRLWVNKSWDWNDVDDRMTYVGLMWAFDQVARVSEYTSAETGAENHCIRIWQLSFILAGTEGRPERIVAGARLTQEVNEESKCNVVACEVEASSHKGGALSKKKVIGRRVSRKVNGLMTS